MAKRSVMVSRAARDALVLLGLQVKRARIEKRWTLQQLADRTGVDARTISSLEAGAPGVAIGTVFNACFTVGVNLFGLDGAELALARRRGEETLALLPTQVRPRRSGAPSEDADDDF